MMDVLTRIVGVGNEAIGAMTKRELAAFCDIETASGNKLYAEDASVATVIEVMGTTELGKDNDLLLFSQQASRALASFFKGAGHAMQLFFMRDPSRAVTMLQEYLRPAEAAARAAGLDLHAVIDERARHLGRFVTNEMIYLVLWTRPTVMSREERKRDRQEQKKVKPSFWPQAIDSQQFDVISRSVSTRHDAFVNSVITSLADLSIRSRVVNCHVAARLARNVLYPSAVNPAWRLFVPEDSRSPDGKPRMPWPRMPRIAKRISNKDDMSHLLWPRYSSQIFDAGAELDTMPGVTIRDLRFAGIDVSRGPVEPRSFNRLISFLKNTGDEPPWRVSFLLEGGGVGGASISINMFLAAMTAPFKVGAADSRLYYEAMQGLRAYETDANGVVARIRISFATWAPADDHDLLNERVNRMQRALETWGQCESKTVSGDPVDTLMSSVPGMGVKATAPAGIAPLEEALYVMPWMRETSPWSEGCLLLRTVDGRPFPYQPGSSLQNAFIDLVYGPAGTGKSFFLNTMGLAFCLSADAATSSGNVLPYLGILDIGSSSSGLILTLSNALPPSMRHQVLFHRLQMDRRTPFNPFDLPLGLRRPLPDHRNLLVNIVTALATPNRQDGNLQTPEGMMELAGLVIDKAYAMLDETGRKSSPKRYNPNEDYEVDAAIEKIGLPPEACETWYGLSRALFRAGMNREAVLAQRHAVPTLRDLLITDNEEIANIYSDNPKICREFERMIQISQGDYPILDGVTKLDLGNARVLSLDLAGVAPEDNVKQTSVMYLLGMHIVSSRFMIHKDDLEKFPEEYRDHHRSEIDRMGEMPKGLVLDEVHRTQGATTVRTAIVRKMLEGRKKNFHVRVASQQLRHFDPGMVESATSIWICGVNTLQEARDAQEVFGLSDEAARTIFSEVRGPKADRSGAPLFALFKLKQPGRHEHVLINTVGPREAWSFSTSELDTTLRDRLIDRIGYYDALARLGQLYPGGSAQTAIIERSKAMLADAGIARDESEQGAINAIVEEIVAGNHVGDRRRG